jgi:hypothetical protein
MKGATAGLSGLAALVLLLPMEAGVPVPLPAGLVTPTRKRPVTRTRAVARGRPLTRSSAPKSVTG